MTYALVKVSAEATEYTPSFSPELIVVYETGIVFILGSLTRSW